ncbi:tripartite motif-containing protein 3-like [Amphiura filiformis]|uniref:tripartite motif-containing protein 3-like n=1 Tax=Amphiura filiformis TaxID=82378 RepID=UPI003B2158BE
MATTLKIHQPPTLAEEIDKTFLNCGICLERFTDPRALPCLHAFCCGCLEKMSRGAGKNLFCPTCRKRTKIPFEGVKGFAPHFLVSYLKDTVDKHIMPVPDDSMQLTVPSQEFCSSHEGESIRYFCETCKITICPDCIILDNGHQDHKYTRLKDIANEQADSLQELVTYGKDIQEQYQTCLAETNQVDSDLEISAQLTYSRLNKIEWNYKSHLELILGGYKRRLHKQEAGKAVVINQIKDELNTNLSQLQGACELAEKVAQVGTEFEIFANYAHISSRLQDLILVHPKAVDKDFGDIIMGGVEADASVAMAIVAKDYDGTSQDHKTMTDSFKGNVQIQIKTQTILKYLLVALFSILIYRLLFPH